MLTSCISVRAFFFIWIITTFLISSLVAENNNSFFGSLKTTARKIDSSLNDLSSTINMPDHTLSWVFCVGALIATPFIIYKTYYLIEQFLLDKKSDSHIIKRSNAILSQIALEFDDMFNSVEQINSIELNTSEKITAKFFFKEELLKLATEIYPFLNYKLHIDAALSHIAQEQQIIQRRINKINSRASANGILSDSDYDCIEILITIHNSLEVLKEKLISLQDEVTTCYEYHNDLMQQNSNIMNTAICINN
jgi:hypothetical protein